MRLKEWILAWSARLQRNKNQTTSFEHTAERLTRSHFTSQPPRIEFQTKLLEKIIERRRHEPHRMLDRTSRSLQRFIHALTAVPVIASILVLAIFISNLAPLGSRVRQFSELLIPAAYAQDNFSIDPTIGDRLGVASSTSFVITSKQPLKREELESALKIVPALEYRLIERSDKEFVVEPTTALAPRTLYRIMIDSAVVADNGITVARPFSFAFEVKEKLRVISSIPGDKTTGVPVKTGVEFSLSHDQIQNQNNLVRVAPSFKFTVETVGRKLIVKPAESLKAGTIYTVTLDKSLQVAGSGDTLGTDYVISFETERVAGIQRAWYLGEPTAEFLPTQKPSFPVYGIASDKSLPGAQATVYRFPTVEAYVKELERFERVPFWSYVQHENFRVPVAGLAIASKFDVSLEKNDYTIYAHFPANLPVGWYVAAITIAGQTRQLMFQVTPWGVFSTHAAQKTVVWLNDLVRNVPGQNLALATSSGTPVAMSDAQGIALVPDTAIFSTSTDAFSTRYLIARSETTAVAIALSGAGEISPYSKIGSDSSVASDYWQYITTDRSVYQVGDTAAVWGFVKPRSANIPAVNTLQIKLLGNGVDWYGNQQTIFEQSVALKLGSFDARIPLGSLSAGYYMLQVLSGETLISSRFIQIEAYEKPVLTLNITPNSYAVTAGEHFSATVKGTFFDGTPAARIPLIYTFEGQTAQVILDDAGTGTFNLVAPFDACARSTAPDKALDECYTLPSERLITVRSQSAEYGDVQASQAVDVFGPKVYIDYVQSTSQGVNAIEVSTTIFTVDLTKRKKAPVATYLESYQDKKALFLGSPVPGAVVDGVLVQTIYTQVLQGRVYNSLTKQLEDQYVSVASTTVAATFSERTNSAGQFIKRFPTQPGVSYTLYLRTLDSNGFPEYGRHSFSGQEAVKKVNTDFYEPYGALRVELVDADKKFVPGEEVKTTVRLSTGATLTQPGKILYLRSNGQYLESRVQSETEYKFGFTTDDIPATYVTAVRLSDSDYQTMEGALLVPFKQATRALSVTVTSTKPAYAPGETATIDVTVRDAAGQPVVGAVNLNVVDEAYYAFNPETVNPLENLYASLGSPFSSPRRTHEYLKAQNFGLAEGFGGCFLAGTLVELADGTERAIESISIGDQVKTFSNPLRQQFAAGEVEKTFKHVVPELIVVNGTLYVTPEHRLFINSGWQTIGSAKLGDVLLSQEGKPVVITSLKHIRGKFSVYNLTIKDYHTFIAGGYFVHNDKDGDRTNFVDTAATLSGTTDAQGKAVFTFKLPDNITSWRATAQVISEKNVSAGVSTTPVITTKPVFVLPSLASQYVAGDAPTLAFQAYGTKLTASNMVKLGVNIPSLGIPETSVASKPFTAQYVSLPALPVGTYEARFTVTSPFGNDSVRLPIKVGLPHLREQVETRYDVEPGTRISGSGNSPTTVVVLDKERGSLYGPLLSLSYADSDRLDDQLAAEVARSAREKFFGESNDELEHVAWDRYQTVNAGLALLPYGGSDPYLSMLVSSVADKRFDTSRLVTYWYGILNNASSSREEIIQSLAGLAAVSEPVLLPLRSMATVTDLTVIEKTYLALGLSFAGDETAARSLYQALTNASEVVSGGRKLTGIFDEDISRQTAGVLAVVGARLNDEQSAEWENTLSVQDFKNPSSRYTLEQVLYISARLPNLRDGEQSFSFSNGNEVITRMIPRGGSVSFDIPVSATVTFGTSTGKMVAIARSVKPLTTVQSTAGYGVRREYLVQGVPTTTFALGDVVEVRLYTELGRNQNSATYELSDVLPTGLAFLGKTRSWLYDNFSACTSYPYAVDGQEVHFFIYGDSAKIRPTSCPNVPYVSYKAHVRGPGTYGAEPSLIQSFSDPSIRGYGTAGTITITTSSRPVLPPTAGAI